MLRAAQQPLDVLLCEEHVSGIEDILKGPSQQSGRRIAKECTPLAVGYSSNKK